MNGKREVRWKKEYQYPKQHGWQHQCRNTNHVEEVAEAAVSETGPPRPAGTIHSSKD
jgi:hypothetical protein